MNLHVRLASLLVLALALCATAQTQVAAPRFLPGQPMVVGNQILMMWAPVPGASRYVVLHNGREIARVSTTQYQGPLPEAEGKHRFQVAAVDAAGTPGPPGEPGVIQVRQLTQPQGLLARPNPTAGSIELLWDKVLGAVIYNLYRASPGGTRQLIASLQVTSYQDATAEVGVAYTYSITARDISGKEGPAASVTSAPLETRRRESARAPTAPRPQGPAASDTVAPLETPDPETEARVEFRALPTEEVHSLSRVDGRLLDEVTYLGTGPGGNLWLVTPRQGTLHGLSLDGERLFTWGPYSVPGTPRPFRPHKLDHGPNGKVYVSDALGSQLACIGPGGKAEWFRDIPTPAPDMEVVWEELPRNLQSQPSTPSSVLCRGNEIWVTDQRFQLIFRLDYLGEGRSPITHYHRDGEFLRLPGVGELLALDNGTTVLTFPFSHRAAAVDGGTREVARFGIQDHGFIGGFVGIHGASWWDEGKVLFTDPTVASLQVFDGASGRYLYHISGPNPRQDPRYKQRADLDLEKPNLAVRAGDGRLWVYDAATRRLSIRRVSGEISPRLEGG